MKLFLKIFSWLEEAVMVVGMLVMVTLNFLNVVARYLLPQSPFSFTEELTVLIFVWVTMFGIACGYKRHSHTSLSLITDMLPNFLQRIFIILSTLASTVLVVLLAYLGTRMIQNQIKYNQIMTALKIPEAVASAAIPVGAVVILVRVLQVGINNYQAKKMEQNLAAAEGAAR